MGKMTSVEAFDYLVQFLRNLPISTINSAVKVAKGYKRMDAKLAKNAPNGKVKSDVQQLGEMVDYLSGDKK